MVRIVARSEADVIDAVSAARARGSTLEIVGHSTKHGYGRPVEASDVLDISALSGIMSYEPDELVLTAKAGTIITEIEDALARRAQRLGFDPADWGPLFGAHASSATIGGVLSADACGSARVRFGACRDHLLGYRAVNGFAESYKAGGRVVKNVTGFDLPKLVCGAMGTLGVLTEVTLRLIPRGSMQATFLARDIGRDAGFALLRRAWTSPFEPTGLAYLPGKAQAIFPELGVLGDGAALIRLEGSRAGLEEKAAGLRALARHSALDEIDGETLFRQLGNGSAFVDGELDAWRVTIPPGNAQRLAGDIGTDFWLADWAGGLIWIGTGPDDEAAALRIRSAALAHNGHATLLRASTDMRRRLGVLQPQPSMLAALGKSVKAAFDPLGIFNPGRLFEGI